ncbi:MAG: nickel insertion protein, partial [Selenomonadaceae bacterium]
DVIFYETTSLGIRKYPVEKLMLDRQFEEISTIYGNVTVKNAYHHGACIKYKPEYEDCRRLATEKQLPLGQIYQEVYKVIEANKDGK